VPSEYDISLNIRNNRNYAQTFNGMGGSVNPLDTSNATTEYRYNITTFNFTDENSITIYYKAVGQSVFSSFTAELPSQNPEGLVIALNGLGIGFFNTYVELGQTFLGTYNENYIFGSLDVYNSSIPTTTTTSTSTTTTTIFVPTTTSTTSTTTSLAPTTSTTTTTTSLAPTTTSTTTTTTSLAPTTTSTTTTTTTSLAPTTTSTTTTTTTSLAPTTTSTTTTTTSLAPTTTSTTTTTTTSLAPTTTSTTTTTTSLAPTTTSTTTTTTTEAATTTSTTTSTTTEAATTTSTTTSTTTEAATTTTTSTSTTTTTLEPTTTTTSTSTTTTTLEPTTTTTSTTSTTTTLAFSGSVGYSGNDATVCYTPVATFTMTGNAGSFCASTIFTSASWGAVASGAYFIAFGGNVLPVNHILGENTATTSGACTACPITTTTSTTTTTTSLPPTTTTTSTTSTTTTLAFSGSVAYSGNDATVCYTPVATFTMTGNAGSFCASTIFTSASWGAVASGAYFIAFGGNVLPVNHILGENTATTSGACTACPITTTTTTTTTSTTSTTTTAVPFSGSVAYSGNDATVCYTPVATFTMTGNAGSFCASTIFTSASWGAVASGAYFIAFGGNILPVNHILGENTATTSGACTACPITTTTTTTTTSTTSTTTTAVPFSGSVAYSGNDATVCYTPVATFTMTGNAGSFCASTIFTSASWGAVASGAYFIAFGGNILPVNHILGENTATTSGACTACPITTTTTSTTSTTSTTTTLPPVTLSLTPGCAGGPGLGTILANNFSGGTGSFEYISISATSQAEALTNLDNPATRTFINGATEYTFTTLANSTYYVAIMDFSGNKGVNNTNVLCTTTTTSTTSTTTTIPIYMYLGNTNPFYSTLLAACQNYATIRPYYSTKSNLNLIGPTDIIYDVYPGTPTNGGNLWVALTSGGVDPKLGFQIGTDGAVITSGGNCVNATTTTTTTTTSTTTTTTTAPITTSTTTTTTSLAPPLANIDIATNNSLDIAISISGIKVSGVDVINVSGGDPNTPGNGGGCQTTEIGMYVVSIPYSASTGGQSISLVDSVGIPMCQGTNSGSDTLIFTGVTINTENPVTITANEGACL
jgi:hypothetical protein